MMSKGIRQYYPLLLIAVVVLAYANSFRGAFVLDDTKKIVRNPEIKRLWPEEGETRLKRRFVTDFTFSVNYAIGELNPADYHVTNLLVHLAAGLLLYGLVRRTLMLPGVPDPLKSAAEPVALVSATAWVVHPLTTSAVTYVCQRYEVLMGMFYLLTLYCLLRGYAADKLQAAPNEVRDASTSRRWRGKNRSPASGIPRSAFWYLCSVLACALGMASKEIMITAPLLALAYDRIFLSGSFKVTFKERWLLYAGYALTWAFVALLLSTGVPGTFFKADGGVAASRSMAYALIQAEVITHYLRLSVWPHPLCLDYAWPPAPGVLHVLPSLVVVGTLGLLTLAALPRRGRAAFPGLCFFVLLAPTSSFLPRPDYAFEHRMYLPLAAAVVGLVLWGYGLVGRLSARCRLSKRAGNILRVTISAGVIASLAAGTRIRNGVFHSREAMWRSVVASRPDNFRARAALASAMMKQGRFLEAETTARELLDLTVVAMESNDIRFSVAASSPAQYYPVAHNQIGLALLGRKKPDEALQHFEEAVKTATGYKARFQFDRALALVALGRDEEAIRELEAALVLKPDLERAHAMNGFILSGLGRYQRALYHYNEALRLDPGFVFVEAELAWLLATCPLDSVRDGGRAVDLALAACEATGNGSHRALEVLAAARAETGRFEAAVDTVEAALQLALRAEEEPATSVPAGNGEIGEPPIDTGSRTEEMREALRLYREGKPWRDARSGKSGVQ